MLTEKTYTLAAKQYSSDKANQYASFFTDALGAEVDLIKSGDYYFLDENNTVGFAYNINSKLVIRAVYTFNGSITTYAHTSEIAYLKEVTLHYHVSKNKNVIYLYEQSADEADYNYYVAAKDEKNIWHIFSGSYIFGAEGQISAQSGVAADTKAPFIASKAIAPDGAKFPELNRLLFATSFEISSTLVAFDGVPHRVVSVDGTAPCFTFPVSEN